MSVPFAAIVTIDMSVYRVAINFLNLAQDAPLIAVNGSTSAITPLGLSLRVASAANAEPRPAWP